MSRPFNTVLSNLRRLRPDLDIQPGVSKPQVRPTSVKLSYQTKTAVELLIGPLALPMTHNKNGTPCKRQPDSINVGATVYVKINHDGLLVLYPFERAGNGYELIIDAEEGVHFRLSDKRLIISSDGQWVIAA